MSNDVNQLFFHRDSDGKTATIASNGTRHIVQVGTDLVEHPTIFRAIASLEAKGFSIETQDFRIF